MPLITAREHINARYFNEHQMIYGETPLQIALKKGGVSLVNELLKAGAHAHDRALFQSYLGGPITGWKRGRTSLAIAMANSWQYTTEGLVETVQTLLSAEPRLVNMTFTSGLIRRCSPLLMAAFNNRIALVNLFLEHGANKNHVDAGGNTALHFAARFGYLELAKILVASGIMCDIENELYNRPLDLARENGHTAIIELLKDKTEEDE